MTPDDLRAICDKLNDGQGTGGQTKLAGLLRWNGSTVRRKLAGKSRITRANELAIKRVMESIEVQYAECVRRSFPRFRSTNTLAKVPATSG